MRKLITATIMLPISYPVANATPQCGDAAVLDAVMYQAIGGDDGWNKIGAHSYAEVKAIDPAKIQAFTHQAYVDFAATPQGAAVKQLIPLFERWALAANLARRTELSVTGGVATGYDAATKTYSCQARVTCDKQSYIEASRPDNWQGFVQGMQRTTGPNGGLLIMPFLDRPVFAQYLDQMATMLLSCLHSTISYQVNDYGTVTSPVSDVNDLKDAACEQALIPQGNAMASQMVLELVGKGKH